jgi:aspartate 1-decarboxylase
MIGLRRIVWIGLTMVITGVLVGPSGCSSRKASKPKQRRIEGIAEKVDLQNNYVSMRVTDKKGSQHVYEGTFKEDTEVEINGRAAKLENVQPGDKVVVYGYREGEGENVKLVATRVEVIRPEGSDWKSTGKPASRAGEEKPPSSRPAAGGATSAPAAQLETPKAGSPNAETVENRREQPANDNN